MIIKNPSIKLIFCKLLKVLEYLIYLQLLQLYQILFWSCLHLSCRQCSNRLKTCCKLPFKNVKQLIGIHITLNYMYVPEILNIYVRNLAQNLHDAGQLFLRQVCKRTIIKRYYTLEHKQYYRCIP